MHSGLVEEDETLGGDVGDQIAERDPRFLNAGPRALRVDDGLFFRDSPSRSSARPTVESPTLTPLSAR
jgi:hypothetical protein